VLALTVVLGLAGWPGCKDARLADATIKPAVVTDVVDTATGLNLDKNAPPAMVAFALLKAIRDDVEAGRDLKAREEAFERQHRLAAPAAIQRHHARFVGSDHAGRDESVFKSVRTWAPTLAYYVDNFTFSWEEAEKAMRTSIVSTSDKGAAGKEAYVRLQVRDPHDDPNASAVVQVRLVQEEGRWRVWWVGFDHTRQIAAGAKPATQPAG
jgi:hypothetical protein